jgi:hypothetical protein
VVVTLTLLDWIRLAGHVRDKYPESIFAQTVAEILNATTNTYGDTRITLVLTFHDLADIAECAHYRLRAVSTPDYTGPKWALHRVEEIDDPGN